MTARSSPQYAATIRSGVLRRADDHRERYAARLHREMEDADRRARQEHLAQQIRWLSEIYESDKSEPWWKFWSR